MTLEQGSSTFRVRGPIYIVHIILWAAVTADYRIMMDILNIIIGAWAAHYPTLTSLHLRHSSFSNPSAVLLTSQLILKPFRCFTYVIGTSPTSQLILQSFRRFIYATVHSTTLPPHHLRHRSFYNPSVASPTSQALHVLHLASGPYIEGWKNSLWWTSVLQQVTKFRSSYSFGLLLSILLRAVNLFSFSHIVSSDSSFNIHNVLHFVKYISRAAQNSPEGRRRPAGRGLKTPALTCWYF